MTCKDAINSYSARMEKLQGERTDQRLQHVSGVRESKRDSRPNEKVRGYAG